MRPVGIIERLALGAAVVVVVSRHVSVSKGKMANVPQPSWVGSQASSPDGVGGRKRSGFDVEKMGWRGENGSVRRDGMRMQFQRSWIED